MQRGLISQKTKCHSNYSCIYHAIFGSKRYVPFATVAVCGGCIFSGFSRSPYSRPMLTAASKIKQQYGPTCPHGRFGFVVARSACSDQEHSFFFFCFCVPVTMSRIGQPELPKNPCPLGVVWLLSCMHALPLPTKARAHACVKVLSNFVPHLVASVRKSPPPPSIAAYPHLPRPTMGLLFVD